MSVQFATHKCVFYHIRSLGDGFLAIDSMMCVGDSCKFRQFFIRDGQNEMT